MLETLLLFLIGIMSGTLGGLLGIGGAVILLPILRFGFEVSPIYAAGTALMGTLATAISEIDIQSFNDMVDRFNNITNGNTPITSNISTSSVLTSNIDNKQYQQMINTTMANLKDINVDGKIDFSEIKVVLDSTSTTIQLSEKDKNEIIKSIQKQILQGGNSIINAGKTTGSDALVGT